ncbi:MAG: hypothetical protein CL424_04850 [Acidimicrobiaceae bacterium]|nr:hypothetical protein [Acidimicrobiaceae bacterium]
MGVDRHLHRGHRRAVGASGPVRALAEAVIGDRGRHHPERVDVDVEHDGRGLLAHGERQAANGSRVAEGGDRHRDVDPAVEVDPVGAVHLAPPTVPVRAEPQVGLGEVAEEEELAHLPQRRQADHVLHVVAADLARRGPGLVVPRQRERLLVGAVPGLPADGVAVGRDGLVERMHRSSVPCHDRYGAGVQPLEDAQTFVLSECPPHDPVSVDFVDAEGLVLAADVVAAEQVPPFDNTAVDGYAVIAADLSGADDTPVELPVVGEIAAGAHSTHVLQRGEAIRIMTGAPMPPGADAVVMVEETERLGDDRVRISASVDAGAAVRRAGDDVQPGDLLFEAGTAVTPAIVGVLASINARRVHVYPRLKVAVLSTGDELVEDGRDLRPGEIRESNRRMLAGMLRETGCEVVDLGIVRDDEDALESVLLNAAASCDAIVTSGGVSMGDYDVVKAVLGQIADMTWMQIAIKPAKPFAFGKIDGTPIFGLPGNPVSSIVSFEMLARPALRRMMGHRRLARPSLVAVADEGLPRRSDGKVHLVRVTAEFGDDGRCHIRSARAQGSHQLAATALSNAIAIVPDGDGIPAGADVAVVMLQG